MSADASRMPSGRSLRALRWLLGAAAIAAVAVGINLLFGASATAQEPGLGAQWAEDEQLVDRGAQLFGANCALCHGEQGRGLTQPGPQAGPSLIGVGAASVDFMVRSGRMPMTNAQDRLQRGPNRFSEEDTRALVAFVESLAPGEGPDIPDIEGWEDADLSHGLELFTRNCAACHGPTAQGIAVGQRDISSSLDVVPPLEIAEAVRSGPGVMPRFLEDTLSDEDLRAVTAWVMDLREREAPGGWSFGRSGPVAEGAIAIIVGLGLLAIVMYLLGEKAHDEYDEVEEYRGER
ncbi:c-type cytochrome [Egicoccus sp. AB-alg2]|uniref:cytochrome bc1 complex diheme cytochrome c subunit n=1 Tax=Egicoccus sp. AB-alg2 TaxID=3242693 RepID=UPI00359D87D1